MAPKKSSNKRSKRETDFFLVQRALCGDQSAYTQIFNSYSEVVKYAVNKILNDRDLTEDVVMETFEKAFATLSRFQPDYQLSAWLVRIGTNRALDIYRHNARTTIISIDERFDDFDDDSKPLIQVKDLEPTPDLSTELLQDVELIKSLLEKLPYWHGRAVRMKFLDDCSYDEIADEFQITRKQARKMVKIGLRELLQIADEEANTDIDIRKEK